MCAHTHRHSSVFNEAETHVHKTATLWAVYNSFSSFNRFPLLPNLSLTLWLSPNALYRLSSLLPLTSLPYHCPESKGCSFSTVNAARLPEGHMTVTQQSTALMVWDENQRIKIRRVCRVLCVCDFECSDIEHRHSTHDCDCVLIYWCALVVIYWCALVLTPLPVRSLCFLPLSPPP